VLSESLGSDQVLRFGSAAATNLNELGFSSKPKPTFCALVRDGKLDRLSFCCSRLPRSHSH
jgi:hypothetical protein